MYEQKAWIIKKGEKRYFFKEKLHQGTFSTIYRGIEAVENKACAFKVISGKKGEKNCKGDIHGDIARASEAEDSRRREKAY